MICVAHQYILYLVIIVHYIQMSFVGLFELRISGVCIGTIGIETPEAGGGLKLFNTSHLLIICVTRIKKKIRIRSRDVEYPLCYSEFLTFQASSFCKNSDRWNALYGRRWREIRREGIGKKKQTPFCYTFYLIFKSSDKIIYKGDEPGFPQLMLLSSFCRG